MVVVSKKNEAMNNVIIIHQDGGSEPDNRTAHGRLRQVATPQMTLGV